MSEVIERGSRKLQRGEVVSTKMQNTVVVRVTEPMRHPRYHKIVKRSKKFYAHSELPLSEGDQVEIMETRPLSKLKRWRVVQKIEV